MPDGLSSLTPAELVTVALSALLVVLLAIFGYRAYQRRRAWLVATGKMGDAVVVEMRDNLVFYSYDVRGVEYTASQDVSLVAVKLPDGLGAHGAVSVKYDPRNPANSIVVAEEWSGLR